MKLFHKLLLWCVSVMMLGLGVESSARAEDAMQLAKDGKTDYTIIVSAQALPGEELAAKELAEFLKQMTDAEFPVKRDDVASSDKEIVLGSTNRLNLKDVPAELQPKVNEGFVLYRQGTKLFILGKIQRATLYGVYDFLEVELGIRFLASDVNYIPHRSNLTCDIKSRKFDPLLEYRNICVQSDEVLAVRSRLNASWSNVPMEKMLGGVRWVGPSFVHTFAYLVPPDKYFDSHPEYFAMVKGKRVKETPIQRAPAQLCLSNPDVLRISVQTVKEWIKDYKNSPVYNPDTQIIVSVSQNDSGGDCECSKCGAINKENKSPSGALLRFVNAVAEVIEKDYADVYVETLAYNSSAKFPIKDRPRKNVIIRFAPIVADFSRPIDDPESSLNKVVYENLKGWSSICKYMYVWNYYTNFQAYLEPFPNLKVLDKDIRTFQKYGMHGLFAQSTQTPGGEMRELRHYLLAQCMWRPQTDGKVAMEEFCNLYYGKASKEILEYIQLSQATFYAQKKPLTCSGGMNFDDSFIMNADAILSRAEASADTPETKQRVAVARLPIWYVMLQKEFGRTGKVVSLPVEWSFKLDPKAIGEKEGWEKLTDFKGWKRIRTDQSWTDQGYDYHGVAWYNVSFDLPISATDKQNSLSLYFGAVDGTCDVFLDGVKVGEQKKSPEMMWNKGFYVPLKSPLVAGRHFLVVKVYKDSNAAGIWKEVGIVDSSGQVSDTIKIAGRRFMEVSKLIGVTHLSEYYGSPGDQFEKDLYPRIRALIDRKPLSRESRISLPGTINKPAAFLPNSFKTFSIRKDKTSENGSCLVQSANAEWTLGQAMLWGISHELEEGEKQGERYQLRARIKVEKKADQGGAFRFGWLCFNDDWSGDVLESISVDASNVESGVWKWYTLSKPLFFRKCPNGQYAFVLSVKNPANVVSVYLDSFELVPIQK
jgi:hypothetical protein